MVDLTREQIDRAWRRWGSSDYLSAGEAAALFAMARAYLSATERQQAGYACAMCPDLAQARIERDTARAALGRCRALLRRCDEAITELHDGSPERCACPMCVNTNTVLDDVRAALKEDDNG